MSTSLTDHDRALLAGEHGEAPRMAMSILTRMAEVQGAEALLDISQAHIDSALYMGDATLEYAERLAAAGAQVVVPTTLNVAGVDPHGWERWAVPPEWATKARRQMEAYQGMGCTPSWTCAPYQTEARPRFGQQIAWGASRAIVCANSVLGARTERDPDLLDSCAAITGRVPAVGLHLDENRRGGVLFHLGDIPSALQRDDALYPVLGHWIGSVAGHRVPVLDGFEAVQTEDQLKAMGAAMASSGSVALFHVVGVTPEAPTVEEAFQGGRPEEVVTVTMDALRSARADLHTADGDAPDMVVLGSPPFSLEEFRRLAPLREGAARPPPARQPARCAPPPTLAARRDSPHNTHRAKRPGRLAGNRLQFA